MVIKPFRQHSDSKTHQNCGGTLRVRYDPHNNHNDGLNTARYDDRGDTRAALLYLLTDVFNALINF